MATQEQLLGAILSAMTGTTGHGGTAEQSLEGILSEVTADGNMPAANLLALNTNLDYLVRDFQGESVNSIDNNILGLSATATTLNLFSTRNDSASSYVWNTQCWAFPFDLTCVAVWNSTSGSAIRGGTAITPRHIVFANHFSISAGATLRFVTRQGAVVSRTMVSSAQIGSTDIRIGTLDSDLPASISPALILPATLPGSFGPITGLPLLFTNQTREARIGDALNNSSIISAIETNRTAWTVSPTPAASGDSGSPVFIIIRGKPVLVFAFYTPEGGPALSENLVAIKSACLIAGNYVPSVVPIHGLGSAAITNIGVAPGNVPILDLNGKVNPSTVPSVATLQPSVEQVWNGIGNVTIEPSTDVFRASAAPSGTSPIITLPSSPIAGKRIAIILPGPSVQVIIGGYLVLPSELTVYYFVAGGDGTWTTDRSARNGDYPIFTGLTLTNGQILMLGSGGITMNGTGDFTIRNTVPFRLKTSAFATNLITDSILATNNSAILNPVTLSSGQVLRRNAANSAFEGSLAKDLDFSGLPISAGASGTLYKDGSNFVKIAP